jgi:hypothetical protein
MKTELEEMKYCRVDSGHYFMMLKFTFRNRVVKLTGG